MSRFALPPQLVGLLVFKVYRLPLFRHLHDVVFRRRHFDLFAPQLQLVEVVHGWIKDINSKYNLITKANSSCWTNPNTSFCRHSRLLSSINPTLAQPNLYLQLLHQIQRKQSYLASAWSSDQTNFTTEITKPLSQTMHDLDSPGYLLSSYYNTVWRRDAFMFGV